ncbi:phospholipid scramblase 2-like [Stylophora pistillata]|uniref:phospholipid scramblase 2-like n=1 Tax=Stylophora pistillata TaxID=50429 RepID=UPI000C03D3A4|nr:phospholipid scramblase 2-like [Stylophora pistillata]
MKILNNQQQEIVHLTRPLRCQSCLFPCCLQEIEVQSPPGTVLGYCAQEWSICIPKFAIQNADRETVLRIEGPFCQCNLCGDVEFQVMINNIVVEFSVVGISLGYTYESVFTQYLM